MTKPDQGPMRMRRKGMSGIVQGGLGAGAIAAVMAVGAGQAKAEVVRLGVDGAVAFAVGANDQMGDRSLGLRASGHWVGLTERLGLGLTVGREGRAMQPIGEQDTATLRTFGIGVSTIYKFGPADWNTRPFAGLDFGWAHLSGPKETSPVNPPVIDGTLPPEPAGPPVEGTAAVPRSSSSGAFVSPMFGLSTKLGRGLGVQVVFRYEYISANKALSLGQSRVSSLSELGVGFGLSYTL